MDLMQRIRDSFDRQGFMATIGASLVAVEPGRVTIRVALTPALAQQQGFAHGALPFAIGDSAAGYAAVTLLEPGEDVVTSEIGIHYLAPGLGEALIARGSVLRPGRRQLVCQSDIFAVKDGVESHVAHMTGTMVRVTPRA